MSEAAALTDAASQTRPHGADCLVLVSTAGRSNLGPLLPDVTIRFESTPANFLAALGSERPRLVAVVSPPAGPGEMRQIALERQQRPSLRAVLLSKRASFSARLHALDMGFDDAIDLDADPLEVSGRLAIAGRSKPQGARIPVTEEVDLDVLGRVLMRDGRPIPLQQRELEILDLLLGHPGEVMSRDDLRRADENAQSRAVNVHIWKLRSKIEPDPATPRFIVTVPGIGYRYDPPEINKR